MICLNFFCSIENRFCVLNVKDAQLIVQAHFCLSYPSKGCPGMLLNYKQCHKNVNE